MAMAMALATIRYIAPVCFTLLDHRPVFMVRPTSSLLTVRIIPTGFSFQPKAYTSSAFKVRRRELELIAPATPTPRELKLLSDIDDQEGFRCFNPLVMFYPRNPKMGNTNPASVIRDALAKVLVFYYPLAGRLREGPGRKLMVDCTGEGVLFIEADTDVTIEELGKALHPPFPCLEKLFADSDASSGTIDSPLIQLQVTRLLCGGFTLAIQINHTMCDGQGAAQFLTALAEMAHGALAPSIMPVWQRELLYARNPPCVMYPHPEYDQEVVVTKDNITIDEMTHKSLFFVPKDISALRRFVPENLKTCTTFEVLTACLWRCRAIALQANTEEFMRLMMFVNARAKFRPCIPVGYYGNCVAIPCVISTAGELCNEPLGHALKLVMKAKSVVTEEYMRSTADLMIIKGRPRYITSSTYIVSDHTRFGFNKLNFGWGQPIYARCPIDDPKKPGVYSDYTLSTNSSGESGINVIIGLPAPRMEKFVKELNIMLN